MLHTDLRVAGEVRYEYTRRFRPLMLIPDEITECTVFIGVKTMEGVFHPRGTGFFVVRPSKPQLMPNFMYLVTARHVIDVIKNHLVDIVYLRINIKGEQPRSVELKASLSDWVFHPDDDSVDVAVLPFHAIDLGGLLTYQLDFVTVPSSMFITREGLKDKGIGIGNEVTITGLFNQHIGVSKNLSIVRMGNIAALPADRIKTPWRPQGIDAYLIEARSTGGLSGSPVFAPMEDAALYEKLQRGDKGHSFFLLGLVHGHYDAQVNRSDTSIEDAAIQEAMNMGIAIIVPSYRIAEVLEQPTIVEAERAAEEADWHSGAATLD